MNNPYERKEKDKKEYIEYSSDDAHETVFKKIIQRSYSHFRLFFNTFLHNMTGRELEDRLTSLREKLETFYTKYLLTLNLHNADIIDSIECLQFKPVTHLIFFRIVNFLNMLTSIKTLSIKKCIFLFNQEVVYSSISPMDLYVMSEFLNDSLFPKFIQRRNSQSFDNDQAGCFMFEHESETIDAAPHVYLRDYERGEVRSYRIVIFNVLNVCLVMFVDGKL